MRRPNEKLVQMRHGESFEDVLKANGATPEAVLAILTAFGVKHGESPVSEGQKIILLPEEPSVAAATAKNSPRLGVRRRSAQGDGRDHRQRRL